MILQDGKNDVSIAGMAPYSFGINAHKELKKVVAQPIDNFMEAFEDINAFYDIVNTAKGSTAHQRKILEIRANRQRQRERLVEENLEMRQQIEELKKRIDILENTIPKPTTVEAIIPFAEYYYGENISFSKEARASLIKNAAAGYTQRYIEGVFEQLNYINTWAKYIIVAVPAVLKLHGETLADEQVNHQLSRNELSEHAAIYKKEAVICWQLLYFIYVCSFISIRLHRAFNRHYKTFCCKTAYYL